MKDRIKAVRKILGLNQTAFAERLALTRSAICKIESGENNPSEQTLKLICKEFNISYLWISEGIGPMRAPLDTDSMSRIDAIMTGENEFAKKIFKEFSRLREDEWRLLEKIIKKISN